MNDELLRSTTTAISKEKEATLEVIRHLREIERRRLYALRGFSSVFEMATKHFGYSEGEAYRRVSAMRLIHEAPELEKKIEDGSLSLTVAAKVRTFCKKNKKDVREVAQEVNGMSSREAEEVMLKIAPEAAPRERVRRVNEEQTVVTIVLDKELKQTLDQLLALRSHVNPGMTYTELIRQLATLGQKAWGRRKTTSAARNSKANTRREVFEEAGDQCTYVDPLTGRRCESTHILEEDHIIPRALGGSDDKENKRVLCREHNQLAAIQKLGPDVMSPYIQC